MMRAVALGLRLARGGAAPARLRSLSTAAAAAIGTWLLLAVAAIARAEQYGAQVPYSRRELGLLLLAIVGSIALPVLVLAATAGRLAAALRDRRLAGLRLLGLTPAQTRTVAVTEGAIACALGAIGGWLIFLGSRPALAQISIAGRHWPEQTLAPRLIDYTLAITAMLISTVAVSALPSRSNHGVLATALSRAAGRPSLWRIVPLVLGCVGCAALWLIDASSSAGGATVAALLFTAIPCLALGVVLASPVLIGLVADLSVRHSRGAVMTIAGRRLQSQPAGVSRVVSGLVIGLFLVTGARAVVVAFENLTEVQGASQAITQAQILSVPVDAGASRQRTVQRIATTPTVRRVLALPQLTTRCSPDSDDVSSCLTAVVGTCAELRSVAPNVSHCNDMRPQWITRDPGGDVGDTIRWGPTPESAGGLTLAAPSSTITLGDDETANILGGPEVFLPSSLPGVAVITPRAPADVVVVGGPGRGLAGALATQGLVAYISPDFAMYDFVAILRATVWAIAGVVLAVGLLSFGIGASDRAVGRRREVVSLQLAGVSASVLRRAQWIENAIPVVVGAVLAIACGVFAGASYLQLDDSGLAVPWRATLALMAVALGASAAVTGLTTSFASPRIRPDLIRAE